VCGVVTHNLLACGRVLACTRAAITNFEILLLPITSIRLGTDLNPNINLKLQQQQQQQLVWSTYAYVRNTCLHVGCDCDYFFI
jgi:hypothetical protein